MASSHLVSVVDVGVGQSSRHELVQHDAEGVHVRLEAVGILVLQPDHLWSLRETTSINTTTLCSNENMLKDRWQATTTDHPQYRSRQLFKLVGATPAGLDCSQTKVTDLHCQILVEENIWRRRGQGHTLFFYSLLKGSFFLKCGCMRY